MARRGGFDGSGRLIGMLCLLCPAEGRGAGADERPFARHLLWPQQKTQPLRRRKAPANLVSAAYAAAGRAIPVPSCRRRITRRRRSRRSRLVGVVVGRQVVAGYRPASRLLDNDVRTGPAGAAWRREPTRIESKGRRSRSQDDEEVATFRAEEKREL